VRPTCCEDLFNVRLRDGLVADELAAAAALQEDVDHPTVGKMPKFDHLTIIRKRAPPFWRPACERAVHIAPFLNGRSRKVGILAIDSRINM
jgi:hypothetical protein